MDYQGNTSKDKEKKPEKQIEKVVTGEVINRPKSMGYRFKTVFLGGDIKSAGRYVVGDVFLPALRNLIWDVISEGSKRAIFGESGFRRRPVTDYRSRATYSGPMTHSSPLMRDPRERAYLPDQSPYKQQYRSTRNDIILANREDAERVVERLIDITEQYDSASIADLYDLLGWASSPIDNKWGWTFLAKVEIRQIRDGFLIELPDPEQLQ